MTRGPFRPATFFVLLALILAAQADTFGERLPIRTYTIEDGLASDAVHRIVRDSAGYLWLLTAGGLCRFDGYFFTPFGPKQGLPSGEPRDFLETSDGVFLVGTWDGVYWYDPAVQSDEPMFRVARPTAGGDGNIINALHEDGDGRIWCGTHHGLYRMERSPDGWTFYAVNTGQPPADIQRNAIGDIADDRHGSLWITTPAGLLWLGPDGSIEFLTDRDGLPHTDLKRLLIDAAGRVWVGTQRGLALLERDSVSGRPAVLRTFGAEEGLVNPSGSASVIWDLVYSSDGILWAGSYGLVRLDPDSPPGSPPLRLFDVPHGLSSPNVMSLAEDLEGNLWAGTAESGVMRLAREGLVSYGPQDGLRVGRVRALAEDDTGALIAVGAGRHFVYTFDGTRFTEVDPRLPEAIKDMGWGNRQISFQDHLGEWWFGTFGGLVRFPRVPSIEDLEVTSPAAHYTTRDGLLSDGVFHLYEDSRGDLWIGTMHDTVPERNGLQRWQRSTEAFHTFGSAEGVPRDVPTAFLEDPSGNLWVGFYASGVGRFREGRFTLFTGKQGAPTGYVSAFHIDRAGRLWIATRCCGVLRVEDPDAGLPSFVALGMADGLTSNSYNCISEDDWGRLYLGSNFGVDRFDPETGRVKRYSREDGLLDNWVQLAFRDREGALWFGTSLGLSRLSPKESLHSQALPVRVRELRVAGESLGLSPFGETHISSLELSSRERQIEVEFSGLSFATGRELRFQYRLAGAEESWSSPTTDRRIKFASLSPGRYLFQVRAVDAGGSVSPAPASVSFRILPPFWRRWWFLSEIALLAVIAGYAAHRMRLKRALELERVRTRIATDLHDDIGSSLSRISILSEVVRRQVGDAFPSAANSMAQIADTARHLVDSMSDIVWAINPKRDRAADLAQRMRHFASDIFTGSAIALRFDTPHNGLDRKLDIELRRQVYLIFKEAVNNAVRHSECSKAEVRLHLDGGWLELAVSDDGRGFDVSRAGRGHGLASMRERAQSIGGSLQIETKGNEGTVVHLRVPLRS